MTVPTFEQPNNATQTGAQYKAAIEAAIAVLAKIGDVFAPHQRADIASNMTVQVDAGSLFVSGTLVAQNKQNTDVIIAPTTNPRIDRVVIDAVTGVASVITGSEAASPAPPAIPSGKLPVCQVLLQTTSTAIANSMITDERTFVFPPSANAAGLADTNIFTANNTFQGNTTLGTGGGAAIIDSTGKMIAGTVPLARMGTVLLNVSSQIWSAATEIVLALEGVAGSHKFYQISGFNSGGNTQAQIYGTKVTPAGAVEARVHMTITRAETSGAEGSKLRVVNGAIGILGSAKVYKLTEA